MLPAGEDVAVAVVVEVREGVLVAARPLPQLLRMVRRRSMQNPAKMRKITPLWLH